MEKPKDIRIQIERDEMAKKLMEKLMEGLEEVKSGTANKLKEKESHKHLDQDSQDESFDQESSDDEDAD